MLGIVFFLAIGYALWTAGSWIYDTLSGIAGPASPEHQAAELLRQQMRAPDSFVAKESTVLWQGKDKHDRAAYVVKVTYNAQNGFGATLRDCKLVAFSMDKETIYYDKRRAFDTCGQEGDPVFDPQLIANVIASQFTD